MSMGMVKRVRRIKVVTPRPGCRERPVLLLAVMRRLRPCRGKPRRMLSRIPGPRGHVWRRSLVRLELVPVRLLLMLLVLLGMPMERLELGRSVILLRRLLRRRSMALVVSEVVGVVGIVGLPLPVF